MIHKKNKLVGKEVNTPDGKGIVKQVEEFTYNNTIMFGVKHDTYPQSRPKGMYKDDILYYQRKDLRIL